MQTNNPLKIGFVLDDSLDTPDGVQQYILTLGAWLRDQGHDVHYLVGQTHRTDIPSVHSLGKNIKVRFNHNRMSIPLPVSRTKITTLLKREDFDILHVQAPYSPFLAGRIIKAAPDNTAVVGTFHIAPHSLMVHHANRGLRLLTRRSLGRFDEIMSVSPVAQKFAAQTFGITSQVVPNTVHLAPYLSAAAFPQYKNELTIMFLGRLVQRKGCQYLLEAVAHMRRHEKVDRPYKVLICGRGPLEPQLRAYAKTHHLDDIVEFVGFVEEADKPRYMASADIAIFPSTGGESFGIVLVEAMAASRGAVLAGDNPGYASVLANHPEALFNPTNTATLAHELAVLLQDPAARRKAHDWQLSEVQQYDTTEVGAKVVEVYHAALHKRRG
ncbi:MAG: glycosyltransferase family 4 protein [Candidatus Saccharibacteria bacterium]